MWIEAETADDLFTKTIDALQPVNDDKIYAEIINANLCINDPTRNTMCECIRKMPLRYAIGELIWYNSRNRNVSSISTFSKFWNNIAESDGTVNSNYGYCIHDKFNFDQWDMVKNLIKNDPGTRQAVIHIKEARNILENPTKDLNCTVSLQFLLRNNALDMITTMRSNDVWLGLPYDVFNFTCMQIQMAMELDANIGKYYHNVGSLHLYKNDVNKILERR